MQRFAEVDSTRKDRFIARRKRLRTAPSTGHPPGYPGSSRASYISAMSGTVSRPEGGSTWAEYVRSATAVPGMNVLRLAQRAKVGRSSLYRWMADDGTRVTIESATKIALAIGDDPANALRAAGSLLESPAPDMSDPVVQRIMSFDIDDEMREMMLERHRENVALQQRRWLEDVERDLGRRSGAA